MEAPKQSRRGNQSNKERTKKNGLFFTPVLPLANSIQAYGADSFQNGNPQGVGGLITPPIQSRPALGVFRPFVGVLRRGGGIVPRRRLRRNTGVFSRFAHGSTMQPRGGRLNGRNRGGPRTRPPFGVKKKNPEPSGPTPPPTGGGGTPPAPCLKKARPKYQTAKNNFWKI